MSKFFRVLLSLLVFVLFDSTLRGVDLQSASASTQVKTEEPAPLLPQDVAMPSYESAFLKMFLTLIGLLVAIFFTVFILKRLSRARANQSHDTIKILEKRALSAKTMLYLIEIGDKQTLVAESQLEIKPILSLDMLSEEEES